MDTIRFIDLFCGIGGFHLAMEETCLENDVIPSCVFASDIDEYCKDSYEANFGVRPFGDITKINETDIPDHDVLFAGFPCQPFSIIGEMRGFNDIRGTLFFDIARIIKEKQPSAFVLENVKQLVGHNKGKTLETIVRTLHELGYTVTYKVLNALNYGLPQKRERVLIVGYRNAEIDFSFAEPTRNYIPLNDILENNVDQKHYASDYIREKRNFVHQAQNEISIWHENKAGNISSYPYSCALRAGASYNYLLVNGERRLTPREMLRLQGFPDAYDIIVPDGQVRKQAGNAVPVNLVKAALVNLIPELIAKEALQEIYG